MRLGFAIGKLYLIESRKRRQGRIGDIRLLLAAGICSILKSSHPFLEEQMTEPRKKITLPYLFDKVSKGEPITWLTCYDYPTAYLQEQAGIEMILVGDSLGMTMLGYDTTLPVTMDDMIRHSQAVRRGAPTAFLVGDMPYMSYQPSVETAIRNAGRFMAESACDAIKLEGGIEQADKIRGIVGAGI